eukprot:1155620-Pelagomonas_calceolata.AAC.19
MQEDGTGSKTQQQRPAFKLAQVTNLGNLLKRGALGRNSTALQQKGSGGDGDALRAAAGTAVEGQAAYPAEVLHATAAEKVCIIITCSGLHGLTLILFLRLPRQT